MELINLYPGSFGSNCYVLLSDGHAAVIDPSANASTVLDTVSSHGAVLDFILLTHGHFDHIMSLDDLRDGSGAPALIHASDAELLPDAQKNAFYYFFQKENAYRPAERTLENGEELILGSTHIKVIHTPGHTRGSVCYLCDGDTLLTGDTLFASGFGRFDLYGGDARTLFCSLSSLRSLPGELMIYPGHGESATLGQALDRLPQRIFDSDFSERM